MGVLDGKVALVTGASGGIGKGICRTLAEAGADVAVHYRQDEAGAEQAAALVRTAGRRCVVLQGNLAIPAEARSVVHTAAERLGGLGILVNNAGTFPRAWALEMSEEVWDEVIDTNLKGNFICSQTAAAYMQAAGWGRIVNIGSIAMRGRAQGAHYSASKAGIAALTRALAIEWAPTILVNCVAPGLTDTPQPRQGMTEEQIADRVSTFPLGRIGRPADIAQAVLFFASPETTWVTGQLLRVDGGDPLD